MRRVCEWVQQIGPRVRLDLIEGEARLPAGLVPRKALVSGPVALSDSSVHTFFLTQRHHRLPNQKVMDSTGVFKETVIGIPAAVARQERVRLSERTIAGLQRAKAQGRVGGRPRTEHDPRTMAKVAALRGSGASIRRIARALALSPTTVARLLRDQLTPAH